MLFGDVEQARGGLAAGFFILDGDGGIVCLQGYPEVETVLADVHFEQVAAPVFDGDVIGGVPGDGDFAAIPIR